MHMTDFAYDRPIFQVPLGLSYPSSPVYDTTALLCSLGVKAVTSDFKKLYVIVTISCHVSDMLCYFQNRPAPLIFSAPLLFGVKVINRN